MEKVIKIGGKEVHITNNVGWTMDYRDQFGKDILPVILPLAASIMETISAVAVNLRGEEVKLSDIAEAIEGRAMELLMPLFQAEFEDLVVNVAWAMAKAADPTILPPRQWVKEFDTFYIDEIVPAIYEPILSGFVSAKNLQRLKMTGEELKNLQPLRSTILSSQGLNEG